MSVGKYRDSSTFDELISRRREAGFRKYAIEVDGEMIDKAIFMDTSWETLEELADCIVYLRFERAKVGSRGLKQEQRRVESWIRSLELIGNEMFAYRARLLDKAPELINTIVE